MWGASQTMSFSPTPSNPIPFEIHANLITSTDEVFFMDYVVNQWHIFWAFLINQIRYHFNRVFLQFITQKMLQEVQHKGQTRVKTKLRHEKRQLRVRALGRGGGVISWLRGRKKRTLVLIKVGVDSAVLVEKRVLSSAAPPWSETQMNRMIPL